jgi:UDP-N-acetyl-D-mannosaminuronic acid dehydrogenase
MPIEDLEEKAVVVGGCGHVGLPLGVALAKAGLRTIALDIDQEKVKIVNDGEIPFLENGLQPILKSTLKSGKFKASNDASVILNAKFVIVVIGTPVDSFLNPNPEAILVALNEVKKYLHRDQILILRSTIFPGVTRQVEKWALENIPGLEVSFCPERIAEGKAMTELYSLPQIIGARSDKAYLLSKSVFERLTPELIRTTPEEAELAKLFTNVWRYIKFATVNQFYMMSNDFNVDFERVRTAMTHEYPRAQDMPGAGFAAGPCLFKDTMQLGAFSNNTFALGHAAMLINEGLPLYLIEQIGKKYNLENSVVGVLGMAFKPEVDDPRASLSYKIRKILQFKSKEVICSDPFVQDSRLVPLAEVLDRADIIIIATPHSDYKNLKFQGPIVDIWNQMGQGVLI